MPGAVSPVYYWHGHETICRVQEHFGNFLETSPRRWRGIPSRILPDATKAPGCRDAAVATGFLLGFGSALFAIGLTVVNQESCSSLCETLGLTSLYAGGPLSAIFGVLTDSVVAAWPLDVTLWVVLGFGVARLKANRHTPLWGAVLVVMLVAVAYGLVLSQLVELTA